MPDDLTLDDLPQPVRVTEVHPDELCVDGDNPNEQNDATFGNLCESMRTDGWLDGPIVANTGPIPDYDGEAEGLIADGEHRWRAAQEIGLTEVPVKFYDYDTDAKRRWHRQHLNKTSGEHDRKRDALEIDYLLQSGFSEEVESLTEATGEDLDELLAEIRVETSTPPAYEYDPDHNVYFEDCVEGMRERLDDDSADMVFTSPPYNIEKTASGTRTSETVDYEDDRDFSEFKAFLTDVFSEVVRVTKPSGHIFINLDHDMTGGDCAPSTWITDCVPSTLRTMIVWFKKGYHRPHYPDRGQFQTDYEPIYHFSDSPTPLRNKKAESVWEVDTAAIEDGGEYGEHPAPYPVALVSKAIEATTSEGDTVLDPFMGSGTTAVAAIQNNRDYVGFELDEEGAYKPIIERRIGEAKRQREASVNQAEADD